MKAKKNDPLKGMSKKEISDYKIQFKSWVEQQRLTAIENNKTIKHCNDLISLNKKRIKVLVIESRIMSKFCNDEIKKYGFNIKKI